MAGGSVEPENRKDQRCVHCKRYFSDRGIKAHENNCFVAEIPFKLVPEDDADAVEVEDDATGGTPPEPTVGTESPESAADAGGSGMPPSEAVTDGGEARSVPTFDSTETTSTTTDEDFDPEDALDDVDDAPDTEDCPKCGADTDMTREDLVDGKRYRCTECRETFVWRDD